MPDGSFPIRNSQDLQDAIKSVGRAKDYEAAKRWIIKRAKELGKEDLLPEDWGIKRVAADELKKALTTLEIGYLDGQVTEGEIKVARNNFEKATGERSGHKYFKREPDSKGGWKYYYTKEQYEREKSGGDFKIGDKVKLEDGYDKNGKPVIREYTVTKPGLRRAGEYLKQGEVYLTSPGTIGFDVTIDWLKQNKKEEKEEYKTGDKIQYNGATIHVGKDTSGGQNTTTYTAPSVSEKTFWDLDKLKEVIDSKGKESKGDKFPTKEDIISKLVSAGNNSEDAKKMVEEHYDYIKRVYPSSGLKKLAEVIRTIY